MPASKTTTLALLIFFGLATAGFSAEPGRKILSGHVPAVVAQLTSVGRLSATNTLSLAIGLPLRNQDQLEKLLQQLYDPRSTNFHKFLQPPEFTARFGPTEEDYAAVEEFAAANGLKVVRTHPNRAVLEVEGGVANVEQAFQVTLRTYRHPVEPRVFFAPDVEPSVPTNLPVTDMWGLSDYALPKPLAHPVDPVTATPLNYNGSGPGGSYEGSDFRNAYAAGSVLTGAGQIVAVAEFDAYYPSDITSYESQCGYADVPLQNITNGVSGVPGYSGQANAVAEVSLDIELAIAMAPGLSKLMVYEGSSPYTVLNKIATDDIAKQISCSWAWSAGPTHNWLHGHGVSTLDSILSQMVAQGQSFFQSSGDSDAYTGSQALSSSSGPIPVDSIYVTSVGGTSLTMNGSGASWSSETVWNWGNNTGSGGGISPNYAISWWQTNVSMAANSGSTINRNIPDVAMTADAVNVVYNSGSSGTFGGTSCAAPLWAGFTALVNQQSAAAGGTTIGFLNPALYAIAAGANYTNCFHDITTGNNIGNNTAGLFNAVTNYDLATGLGTPKGTNLINVLAPLNFPSFLTQPSSQTVTNGTSLVLSASLSGQTPLSCQWLFNGTNLPAGGNISGTASNVLSITSAMTNNSGNYSLVVTNNYGSATSSVAVLKVGFAPVISMQPANLAVLSGGNAVFSGTAGGSPPLVYQWARNGTNISNGAGISGATSNVLTLTAVTANSSGNYNLSVTNIFGVAASSVAVLTVALPPSITSSSLTNRILQCGSNNVTFAFTAAGTPPLDYQWSFDGTPVADATNTSFSVTNLHLPNHLISVAISNSYASLTSNALMTVQDTLAPTITLNGGNPLFIELGSVFTDPGASANDLCAGAVGVVVSGTVNTNSVGTNTLVYTAGDGNGNTNTTLRTVIVRDTTPPTILWSFTNLVLAADTNCSAAMPDVTGTNFILATDLSDVLTNSQSPTNRAILPLGTNLVVINVQDASGNTAYSTNQIIVQDQTPPVITLIGGSLVFSELGQVFADPGATANDACAGAVAVEVSGSVNINAVGTNTLAYTADNGNGYTNTVTRTVIVRDTTPPTILWSFTNLVLVADTNCSAVLPDVTGTNFILATDLSDPLVFAQSPTNNVVLPIGTNTVVISVADAYGNTAYSTNTILVQDQTPPVITLNGGSPIFSELGQVFADPGATASSACAGPVAVLVSGSVNINAVGTNTLAYTADNGNGYTNTVKRTVIVRDTTPPTILWSFTNLVLAADTNCSAVMPDVTGTNFILATDLSGLLAGSQTPTNGSVLLIGTNVVVIAVPDLYSNVAFATNTIIVQDQTPPVILDQPQSQTNSIGGTANFSVAATACTPLSFQWYFGNAALATQTNSTLTLPNLDPAAAGNYAVVISAAGGATTSAVATLSINLLSTSVALASSENPSGFNDGVNFIAAITPATATGSIQFFTNGTAFDLEMLVAGQATSTNLSTLPRGTNVVTAVYFGDANDLPATNLLLQVVTNHPPSAVPALYTNVLDSSLIIAIADLATNWSDVDGDVVSLADVSVSTNGITLTNNGLALVYFNSNNVADQFTCTITDGWGGTNFQTVFIAPATAPAPDATPLIISVAAAGNGTLTLSLGGAPGSTYVLEATSDLLAPGGWQPVATNILDNTGIWQFNDTQATNFPQRFYRLKLAQ